MTDYTPEQVDLRNLIYADLQFEHRGETNLKLPELRALVERGWMQEGDENNEFDLTDAGRMVVAATLHQQGEQAGGVVSDDKLMDAVQKALLEYRLCNWADEGGDSLSLLDHLSAGETIQSGRDEIEQMADAMCEAVAPFLRAPTDGHEVKVLSHDGGYWTQAKWERQEGAYVTYDAIRLRDVPGGQSDPDNAQKEVAWLHRRRDYPDEWKECTREEFEYTKKYPDCPYEARELYLHTERAGMADEKCSDYLGYGQNCLAGCSAHHRNWYTCETCKGTGKAALARVPLSYATTLDLYRAFKTGTQFVLHYHGKEYPVERMEARDKVVYVQPPGLAVKVFPDGRSAEGPSNDIWLQELPAQNAQGEDWPMNADVEKAVRVFSYKDQPGNVAASRMGGACRNAKPGGDSIDHGLSLLKELQARGFGIAPLDPAEPDGKNASAATPYGGN